MRDLDIVRRVLDLEEVKSFHCYGPVTNIENSAAPTLYWPVEVWFENPVPVMDSSCNRVGFACFNHTGSSRRGWLIDAQIFMTRESPERLDIEQQSRTYYSVTDKLSKGVRLVQECPKDTPIYCCVAAGEL